MCPLQGNGLVIYGHALRKKKDKSVFSNDKVITFLLFFPIGFRGSVGLGHGWNIQPGFENTHDALSYPIPTAPLGKRLERAEAVILNMEGLRD